MSNEELDKWIERFKRRFEIIAEALGDMDDAREREAKEFNRRIKTLEYAVARLYEERNKGEQSC